MKKLSGFSLMEMMVVLLIVAVVAAASAPMVNKKLVGVASDKSPWVWVGTNKSIAYNLAGANQTASIGTVNVHGNATGSRLYLDTKSDSGNYIPQLALGNTSDGHALKLLSAKNNIWFSTERTSLNNVQNSVVLGSQAAAANHGVVAIGHNSYAEDVRSIAIGADTRLSGASTEESVAVGSSANIKGPYAVAVGHEANGASLSAIAIGRKSVAGYNATATGPESNACGAHSVALGYQAKSGTSLATGALAGGTGAIAIGARANALAQDTIAIGVNATTNVANSVVIGRLANTTGGNNSIAIGNYARAMMPRSVAIGENAYVNEGNSTGVQARAVAIGYNAVASHSDTVAIGGKYGKYPTRAQETGAIAIGSSTKASGRFSIAIGGTSNMYQNVDTGTAASTSATAQNAVAIGTEANASHTNSVAIGPGANTTTSNQIVLGTADSVVYIPGKLVVDKDTFLGVNAKSLVYARTPEDTGSNDWLQILRHWDDEGWALRASSNPANYTVPGHSSKIRSDKRLKNIGKAFESGLNEIRKLEVFNYTFKSDKSKTPRVGVMAQDLQKIFPNAVTKGEDGFLRIRMEDMFYALINAVKEIDVRVTKLEQENIELKKQNQELIKRLAELERKVK